MLMFKDINVQFVGVARDGVSMGESDKEPCQDLGTLQIECAKQGEGTPNCITKFEDTHRTWDSCETECQKYQDLESPCVFYVFEPLVIRQV